MYIPDSLVHLSQHYAYPSAGPELYSTPQEQQLAEVYRLLDLVEQHDNIILLGDFNHGPAVHNTTWRAPFNYGLMNARGLISVNSVWCAQCTICKENPFSADQNIQIIDHIYVPVTWLSRVSRVSVSKMHVNVNNNYCEIHMYVCMGPIYIGEVNKVYICISINSIRTNKHH